jgi:thiol-disulfide isomerase/thioredoxin
MALKLLNISVVMGKKLFLLISALLLLVLFTLPVHSEEGSLFARIGIQPVRGKKKAPACCLDSLNRGKVQLVDLKDKIIFLNFWASWCGPCKEEMPSIEALCQRYKERDFIFLTISVDYEGPEPVRKFIEKHRYRFLVLLDPKGKTLDLFEISKIPTTLIIDRKGTIIGRVIGPRNWNSPEVFSLIDQMLNDGPSRIITSKE